MLSVKSMDDGMNTKMDEELGPDESIARLSECFGHIGKQLYRSLDQPQLLKELNFLTLMFIENVKTEIYP